MTFRPPFNSSVFNALDKERKSSPGAGVSLPNICDVCGKQRANHDHRRCSRIRQRRRAHAGVA